MPQPHPDVHELTLCLCADALKYRTGTDASWILMNGVRILTMQGGFALLEAGSVRSPLLEMTAAMEMEWGWNGDGMEMEMDMAMAKKW